MSRLIVLGLLVASSVSYASNPSLPAAQQEDAKKAWPDSIPIPVSLSFYKRTEFTQGYGFSNMTPVRRLFSIADEGYPNNTFPWSTPGGLHESTGWKSYLAISLPGDISVWTENRDIGRPGMTWPVKQWRFPKGTVFADLLVNSTTGKAFELRLRERGEKIWDSRVAFRDIGQRPARFTGARKGCIECHAHAGANESPGEDGRLQSHSASIRGSDTVFSFYP